jgi:hypothetical protein
MSTLSVKEALAKVLKDMRALSAEQLRAELDVHTNGSFAVALREAQEFLAAPYLFHGDFVNHIDSLLQGDLTVATYERSIECLEQLLAANDNSYALAA